MGSWVPGRGSATRPPRQLAPEEGLLKKQMLVVSAGRWSAVVVWQTPVRVALYKAYFFPFFLRAWHGARKRYAKAVNGAEPSCSMRYRHCCK